MKNFTATSALASKLFVHKLYNSSQYVNFSTQIAAFSKALSKKLKDFSEIDSATAALFQSMMYSELKDERKKNQLDVSQFMSVQTTVYPPCFDLVQGEADAIASNILEALHAIESHTVNIMQQSLTEPAAQNINDIVDIKSLIGVSGRRSQQFLQAAQQITDGIFWTRDKKTVWTCLQCGTITCTESAFTECECCHATRENAAG